MEEAYDEARKVVNIERKLKLDKKSKAFVEAILEKEKKRIIPHKVIKDKVITNKNKHFALNHRWGGHGQEITNLAVDLYHLLKVHL